MSQDPDDALYTDIFLVESIPNLLCIKDHKSRWLQASHAYLHYCGLELVDYIAKTNYDLSQYEECNLHALRLSDQQEKKAWEKRKSIKTEKTLTHRNGEVEKFEFVIQPVFNIQGERLRLFITGRIITETEKKSADQSFLASIYQCQHLNIIIVNEKLQVTHINKAASILTGFSVLEIKGRALPFIFDTDVDFESIYNFDFKKNHWEHEIQCQAHDQKKIPIKITVSPIPEETTKHYCLTLQDITEQKRNEKRINQIVLYDDLTGLGNRAMFFDNLNKFISAAQRNNHYAIVFFIDLDNFKAVNDSQGHDAGDELLKSVAKRLISIIREHDCISRFSGDEFTVLMINEKSHETAVYESSLIAKKIIASLSESFEINRQHVFIGCSIGISIYPEDGRSCEGLLKSADLAMYEAKNKGRNNYQFYKKEYTTAIKDKIKVENFLRTAITNRELRLFYQPQFEAVSKKLWGAEVLIRWFRDDANGKHKMIPPDHFIPIAEESGLIIEIGQWVLERACKQHKLWLDLGYDLPRISVNISIRQFIHNDFIQMVVNVLNNTHLPPDKLELEITESMLMGDTKLIELKLRRLKSYGVSIALDDFGTGYSSLSYLKNFPIDILKIDQSFIREMTEGSKDARIARAIIEMGHSLGQKIIAEGVEDENQLEILIRRRCDIIQGYFFSKPLPTRKMAALLQAQAHGNRHR